MARADLKSKGQTAPKKFPDFPPVLDGFADRLLFIRVFVARHTTSATMARQLAFPESTYATWEKATPPHDHLEVAARIGTHFGKPVADWLLSGGPIHLSWRACHLTGVESVHQRLPFKLPPARTDTTLTVA